MSSDVRIYKPTEAKSFSIICQQYNVWTEHNPKDKNNENYQTHFPFKFLHIEDKDFSKLVMIDVVDDCNYGEKFESKFQYASGFLADDNEQYCDF
jgi:hypothetical protein